MLDGALGWISRPHVTGFEDNDAKYWKTCANGILVLEQKDEILFSSLPPSHLSLFWGYSKKVISYKSAWGPSLSRKLL